MGFKARTAQLSQSGSCPKLGGAIKNSRARLRPAHIDNFWKHQQSKKHPRCRRKIPGARTLRLRFSHDAPPRSRGPGKALPWVSSSKK